MGVLCFALALALPSQAHAQKAAKEAPPIELSLPIERVTLDNGLRVVLSSDRTSPTVAVSVTYDVGSRDEERGRSGFAHLFEHMMFQGSRNIAKGDHPRLVAGHGGMLDGTTSPDRTLYFELLPSNELALALWLEADRMKSLDVTEENFENQRSVVKEEFRMRVSNAAYEPSLIRLEELVYQGYWPYEHAAIGSMADLDGARFDWVRAFHAGHYGPDSAVLAIAGDFEVNEAKALVQKYFGGIAKVGAAPFKDIPVPEQTSPRTAVVKDSNARTPGVLYGWPVPPMHHADHHALEIAAMLLGDGETSRLHELLVRDKGSAQSVTTTYEARRGPGLFSIDARLIAGAKVADVEKLIDREVKALATSGPTAAELAKAKRRAQAAFVFGLQSNGGRAMRLGEHELFFGDARQLNDDLDRYLAVTKEDVQRVVRAHLSPSRRALVETTPADAPAEPAR